MSLIPQKAPPTQPQRRKRRAQSLVETALFFPILLIIFSSLIEVGFWLVDYLSLIDATRNAARFSSDGYYYVRDNDTDCQTTHDFYRQTACALLLELAQERPHIALDKTADDIVVSAVSVEHGVGVTARFPDANGWSLYGHFTSRLSNADINNRLDLNAPSTGLVVVEVFYHYHQRLKLPWVTPFIPDPILIYTYAIMPLTSAEPTPTPAP